MFLPTRHFSPFKLFLDRDSRTALMLNPKVLTSFSRAMLADGFRDLRGMPDPSNGRWPMLKLPRRFPVAPAAHYAGFIASPARYDLHAFVRNPYGRLASAWKNKFLDGHLQSPDHSDARYPRSIRQHELQPLRRFAAARGMAGAAPNTLVPFETFLHYALSKPEGKRDHHWDTQNSVLLTDRLAYAHIWRMEDELDLGFLTLATRLGFPADWVTARLNRPVNPSVAKATVFNAQMAALALPLVQRDLATFAYDAGSWREF
jgi:hypothetical protein